MDQLRILHRGRLVEVWADLMLPRRVRQLWEERFLELARATLGEPGADPTADAVLASEGAHLLQPASRASRHTPA